MRKKRIIFLIMLLLVVGAVYVQTGTTQIFAETDKNLEQELEQTVDEQLENLDIESLENIIKDFSENQKSIFGESSVAEKINNIISGEFKDDSSSVFQAIINIIFEELLKFLPIISMIIAIAILSSLLSSLKSSSNSIGNIIHFVCYGVVIVLVCTTAIKMITLTGQVLTTILSQMEVLFPILLTLLTAIGGTVSVAVYQPAVVILTTVVTGIFTNILMPIFIFTLVFSVISNLSNSVKIDKISGFLSSLFKWIIGITFTIFMAFLAIKGITAGSVDSVAFKTARYSLSTYIPIVGGYLSEGLNVILASCLLIKSAIGTSGILILIASIIVPLLQLIIFMLILKFTGAILQPLSDSRISNFVSSVSKAFIMPIVMILAVAFMYVIFVGLIMCTSVSL